MEEKQEWTCACGQKNSGNFCEMCGKPRPEEQSAAGMRDEALEETQAQPTAQPAALLPPAQAAAILRSGQPLALRYVERGEGDLTAAWKG